MSSIDQGDTVEYVYDQLRKLIKQGRGQELLWVDVGSRDTPADLYAGEDEDADSIGYIGIN